MMEQRAIWRMKVDLPAILGPVSMIRRLFSPSKSASLGTKPPRIAFSRTGCLAARREILPSRLNSGRTMPLSTAASARATRTSSSARAAALSWTGSEDSATFPRTEAKISCSKETDLSWAERTWLSISFSSGVMNLSALASVCLRI